METTYIQGRFVRLQSANWVCLYSCFTLAYVTIRRGYSANYLGKSVQHEFTIVIACLKFLRLERGKKRSERRPKLFAAPLRISGYDCSLTEKHQKPEMKQTNGRSHIQKKNNNPDLTHNKNNLKLKC